MNKVRLTRIAIVLILALNIANLVLNVIHLVIGVDSVVFNNG